MKTAPAFESKTCSRCGGSGHYSFNQIDGTRCYGCHGKGVQLTKRGAAASEFFLASLVRRYDEIGAGWRVFDRGAGWRTVTQVEVVRDGDRCFGARGVPGTGGDTGIEQQWIPMTHRINTKHVGFVGEAHQTMTAYADRAEYEEKMAAALAYQATLTQQGSPRKRTAAEVSHDANLKARAEGRPVSS